MKNVVYLKHLLSLSLHIHTYLYIYNSNTLCPHPYLEGERKKSIDDLTVWRVNILTPSSRHLHTPFLPIHTLYCSRS